MHNISPRTVGRRALIKGTAMLAVAATARAQGQPPPAEQATTLAEAPLGPSVTVTVERRGDIVLVGLNRPFIQNRIDPPTRLQLAATYYQYEHDASLRALVLFGHGEHFSRGIDVDAAQAGIISGQRPAGATATLDVLGNSQPHRSKPVVVVVHGDTWNLGHEIYLASDVRVAAANTRSGRTRTHTAAFPAAARRCVSSARRSGAMRCATC
jgi:enoyl-CoA hydratase